MSAQTMDQRISPVAQTPASRRAAKAAGAILPLFGSLGILLTVAVALIAVGVAAQSAAALVIGVTLGVAAAFVLASREMGDQKVS